MRRTLHRRRTCEPTGWGPRGERPRVLVESREAWAFVEGLERAGYDVATCRGPSPEERCPLLERGVCAAAAEADLIVSALAESDGAAAIVARLTERYPGTPVVAEAPRPKAALYGAATKLVDAPLELPPLLEALPR